MKTLKNATEVKRVKDEEAVKMVEKMGWSYCAKSEYKKLHGKKSAQVSTKKVVEEVKEEAKVKKGKGGSAAAEAKYREKKSLKS